MPLPRPTHPHPLQFQNCSCSFPQRERAPDAPAESFSAGEKSRGKHSPSSPLAPGTPPLPHSKISDRTAQSLPAVRRGPAPPDSQSSPTLDPRAPSRSLPASSCDHVRKDCCISHKCACFPLRSALTCAIDARRQTDSAWSTRFSRPRTIPSAYIHKKFRRLIQPHAIQFPALDLRLQQFPNNRRDVFTRGNLPSQLGNLVIQMTVVHPLHHFSLQNVFQLFQIQNHSSRRIRLSGNRHFQNVVVPMPVRIIALPKNAAVLFRRKIRIMIKMRGAKFNLPCDPYHAFPAG